MGVVQVCMTALLLTISQVQILSKVFFFFFCNIIQDNIILGLVRQQHSKRPRKCQRNMRSQGVEKEKPVYFYT